MLVGKKIIPNNRFLRSKYQSTEDINEVFYTRDNSKPKDTLNIGIVIKVKGNDNIIGYS